MQEITGFTDEIYRKSLEAINRANHSSYKGTSPEVRFKEATSWQETVELFDLEMKAERAIGEMELEGTLPENQEELESEVERRIGAPYFQLKREQKKKMKRGTLGYTRNDDNTIYLVDRAEDYVTAAHEVLHKVREVTCPVPELMVGRSDYEFRKNNFKGAVRPELIEFFGLLAPLVIKSLSSHPEARRQAEVDIHNEYYSLRKMAEAHRYFKSCPEEKLDDIRLVAISCIEEIKAAIDHRKGYCLSDYPQLKHMRSIMQMFADHEEYLVSGLCVPRGKLELMHDVFHHILDDFEKVEWMHYLSTDRLICDKLENMGKLFYPKEQDTDSSKPYRLGRIAIASGDLENFWPRTFVMHPETVDFRYFWKVRRKLHRIIRKARRQGKKRAELAVGMEQAGIDAAIREDARQKREQEELERMLEEDRHLPGMPDLED